MMKQSSKILIPLLDILKPLQLDEVLILENLDKLPLNTQCLM